MKRTSAIEAIKQPLCVVFVTLTMNNAALAQEVLGTSMGIPNSSPGVQWPRGFSLESLGTGRLYPNGPEFGISTTAGGFGSSGTGRISGVGLTERSVSGLAGQELDRPFTEIRTLTDTFSQERARGSNFFGAALGTQFRSQMQPGTLLLNSEQGIGSLINQPLFPGVDAILHDRADPTDSVLRTGQ